jgi:hypothetical protein
MGDVRLSAVSHQVSGAIRVWRRLARAGLKLLFFVLFSARLNRLLKTSVARRVPPAAAKAGTENKAFIAAVNRCTTQKQDQNRVFQQTVKPRPCKVSLFMPRIYGTRKQAKSIRYLSESGVFSKPNWL